MTMTLRPVLLVLLLLSPACSRPAPRPVAPAPAPAVVPPLAVRWVWTREPGVAVRPDSGAATVLPWTAVRLEVLASDSARVRVRCAACRPTTEGWVPRSAVVHAPLAPRDAAAGELAEFVVAVRHAASRQDVAALRPVMARNFVWAPEMPDGPIEAMGAWERERFRSLDRLPFLLDRGVAAVEGTVVWGSPPEYATDPAYRGLRAGFRRREGRWEWLFLVSGGQP